MFSIIQVMCPKALCLSLNSINNSLRFVYQTVSLYDRVFLKASNYGNSDVHIMNFETFSVEEKQNINQVFDLFFEYIKLPKKNFFLKIEKNNPSGLGQNYSILAGVLIALNYHYKNRLSYEELQTIASKIDVNVAYFLLGGYASLNTTTNELTNLHFNNYTNYLVIDSSLSIDKNLSIDNIINKNMPIKDSLFTNYCIDIMPYEVQKIYYYLNDYPNIKHTISGLSPVNFVAFQDDIFPAKLCISLKREFSNLHTYMCKNVSGHKVIVKYKK